MLTGGGEIFVNEINTTPGSLAYYLFCERISDARVFFGDLLEEAIRDAKTKEKRLLTTGILRTAQGRMK